MSVHSWRQHVLEWMLADTNALLSVLSTLSPLCVSAECVLPAGCMLPASQTA